MNYSPLQNRIPIYSRSTRKFLLAGFVTALTLLYFFSSARSAVGEPAGNSPAAIRLGFFPNITHAQALYAKQTGAYDRTLGAPVNWIAFNAGPSAVEALFTDEIDASYIGPNPTINGFIKSRGEKFVVAAGAAVGGAGLVVRSDSGIASAADFNGKTIATPQLGNTQDIAARKWFKANGYVLSEKGGTVTLLPIANPDQLNLFRKKELDGSWSVEPWLSRLEQEAGGILFLDEAALWPAGRYVTTNLVISRRFLANFPDLAEKLIRAHIEVTEKINSDKTAAASIINQQLKIELGAALGHSILISAINRVQFTWDPVPEALYQAADAAYEVGFSRDKPDLNGIFQLDVLNKVLRSRSLQEIDAAKH